MELKLAKSTLSQANAKNKVNVAKISYEDMLKKCAQGEPYSAHLHLVKSV